ncbi:MAG: glycosyltransferase family 2 protein [Balneolaceae bacterium]|nr:glycosyltransferase family 2 protein [Balneolaceae bacterium]MCH8549885.1 glycosyltransferase family 2 protein [Balneolaceae bacterium]
MPDISVIIPTYNHEEFIEETLESVFRQTFKNFEVIVVNDGSPDQTSKRLEPYIKKGEIRYFEKENGGQADARNFGLAEAKGRAIAFLDDDDIWPEDKLAWQYDTLYSTTHIAVGGDCGYLIDSKFTPPQTTGETSEIDFERLFNGNPFVSPGQVLISADALKEIGGFDTEIWGADDLDLWMRLSQHGTILKVSRNALWYRKHSLNASHDRNRMLINSEKVIKKNLKELTGNSKVKYQQIGYRWLYGYTGREQIRQAKDQIKGLKIREFIKTVALFNSVFFAQMLKDRKLTSDIFMDWIPNRIRDIFR